MRKIIIILLSFLATTAHAVDFEASIGQTTFTKPDNGLYWQNGFRNDWQLASQSWYIGVTGMASKNVRWRAGYLSLGSVHSYAFAVNDENYNGTDGCGPVCGPFSFFSTEGSVRGFPLTLAYEWGLGGFKPFVEAGAFVYLPKVEIISGGVPNSAGVSAPPGRYHYKNGFQVGPTVGIGIERGSMQIVLSWYGVDAAGPNPEPGLVPNFQPGLQNTFNVSLRQKF